MRASVIPAMCGPWRLGALVLACTLSLPASADDVCEVALGHGWPPATENYGSAVEQLLADGAAPALMLTRLPARGAESALMLSQTPSGGWMLRFAEADRRVLEWTGSGSDMRRELVVDQHPERMETAIPPALAQRVVDEWRRTLASVAPAGRDAPFSENDGWSIVIDGERISGATPNCGPAELLVEQVELLIEAVDASDSRRARRWEELAESLDEMVEARAEAAGSAENA